MPVGAVWCSSWSAKRSHSSAILRNAERSLRVRGFEPGNGAHVQAADTVPLRSSQRASWQAARRTQSAGYRSWLSKKCTLDGGPGKADACGCGGSLKRLPRGIYSEPRPLRRAGLFRPRNRLVASNVVYRHNNQISIVLEAARSLIYAGYELRLSPSVRSSDTSRRDCALALTGYRSH
jgi:hypothetical protein